MKGWKTYLAAALSILYGIGGYFTGLHQLDEMMQFIVTGIGLVGVGHKIDKAGEAYADAKKQPIDELVRQHQSD